MHNRPSVPGAWVNMVEHRGQELPTNLSHSGNFSQQKQQAAAQLFRLSEIALVLPLWTSCAMA